MDGGNKLAVLLGGTPPEQLLGSGMAADAAKVLKSRAYQLHVQEAKALGQTPMTPEQFARQMMGGGA